MIKCNCGHRFKPVGQLKAWTDYKNAYNVECPKCRSSLIVSRRWFGGYKRVKRLKPRRRNETNNISFISYFNDRMRREQGRFFNS